MARDYNNRRSAARKNSAPQQLLVVLLSFLLGYLAASVVDLPTLSQWVNSQVLETGQDKPQAKPAQQQAHKTQQTPPKTKFEFYTLLEKDKVPHSTPVHPSTTVVSTKAVEKPSTVAQMAAASAENSVKTSDPKLLKPSQVKVAEGKPIAPASQVQVRYVLQVAAFKARSDADHMKANLTLKGYNVNVSPVTNARGNWFRVVIGPYPTKLIALQAQAKVAKNERLNGMVNPVAG